MYKLLADASEDGIEGPTVWANATHFWSSIPTYQVYTISGVFAFRPNASTIDAVWTTAVDYYVELTERQPYNTSSVGVVKELPFKKEEKED